MARIEESIEVDVAVRTAYNQWTQFEEFPRFMEGVEEVVQLDDTTIRWKAEVAGQDKTWKAGIIEQIPDQKVSWRSIEGAENAGTVKFESVGPDRTRVNLVMEVDPEGPLENLGTALGFLERRVKGDLERFKRYIESRGQESGAWRGSVRGGEKTSDEPTAPR
jgi:uncharacterized membrane protein